MTDGWKSYKMEATRKIRVLQAIRQGKIGGGESHVLDLVRSLDRSRFEPVVLSFTDGPMVSLLQNMDVPVFVIGSEKAFDISVWKKVRALMIQERIDIVHVHGTRANTNVMWAARRLRIPLIYTVHGWSFHDGLHPVMRKARILSEQFITRRANVNICVSESNRQTGLKTFGRFQAEVIRNGINPEKFNPAALLPDVRKAYGIPEDSLVVGYIARMTLQKDPEGMIRGFHAALKSNPGMVLLMVGEGELKQAAVDTAAALGISDKVIFDNFRQDVPAVLQGIDIYCLPSLWEGFPIGVLEAMAMGKTVVATDVDGTREAVTHEENGWLIPPKNTAALAGAIAKMAADEPLRAKLSQAAIQTVQEKYNVSGMTRRIENVYTSLFSDKVQ